MNQSNNSQILKKTQKNLQQSNKLATNKEFAKSPSIHNIMVKDRYVKSNQKIRELFKSEQYSKFTINYFPSQQIKSKYMKDQRIFTMVKQLQRWNKQIDQERTLKNKKCEFIRNKHIHNELKILVSNKQIGSETFQINLNKLYQFYLKNSSNNLSFLYTLNKKRIQEQDDGWKVRKTFKTNNALELDNYTRKLFYIGQNNLSMDKNSMSSFNLGNNFKKKNKSYKIIYQKNQEEVEKVINRVIKLKNQGTNFQQRLVRQIQEIQEEKQSIFAQRARLEEARVKGKILKDKKIDFFFEDSSTIFLPKKIQTLNTSCEDSRGAQYSQFEKQNHSNGFKRIKKYRLQHGLQNFYKQNNLKNSIDSRLTKSFFTSRVKTSGEQKFKEHNMTVALNETKDYEKDFYINFAQIKNWGGEGLTIIPVDKKLKKISKK